jgi:outer membrane protein OmpA-like peptidoglycan-associated protein
MNMKKCIVLNSIALLLITLTTVHAGDDTVNYGKTVPSIDDMTSALAPESPAAGYKTRSIQMVKQKPKSVSLYITFEKNSYTIDQHAVEVLDVLGKSLQSDRLKKFRFALEGHTDSTGTPTYNQMLSEKRASAVKNYLAQNYGISQSRLNAVGKGETEPLITDDPSAAANRRVKIINTGR